MAGWPSQKTRNKAEGHKGWTKGTRLEAEGGHGHSLELAQKAAIASELFNCLCTDHLSEVVISSYITFTAAPSFEPLPIASHSLLKHCIS